MVVELMQAYPQVSIIVISVVITFVSSLITKWLTNQEHLRSLKKRQKELQADLKKHKDNPDKIKELQAEMMSITGVMMKSSFKPLFITFIPFLILIYWLRGIYDPILGGWWIAWYIGASLASSIVFRKVLKMA
ncbi:MAG: EMC3/TMCO1 family protein [Candidatus Nanoarchaeia archaeon]